MSATVRLYSEKSGEIKSFIKNFFNKDISVADDLIWEKTYENPVDLVDLIGVFVENNYDINMWINLDDDVFINITKTNADEIIRYIFERFPY